MKTQTIWLSMNTFTLILDGTVHHNLIIRWLRFAARQPTLRSSTSTRGTSWATPTPPWTASGGSNSTAPPNKVQLLDFSIEFSQGFLPETICFLFSEHFWWSMTWPLPESWCDLWKIYTLSLVSDFFSHPQSGMECTTGKIAEEHRKHSKWQLGWETSLNHRQFHCQLTYHSFQEKSYV